MHTIDQSGEILATTLLLTRMEIFMNEEGEEIVLLVPMHLEIIRPALGLH